jgi:hypothetical protein
MIVTGSKNFTLQFRHGRAQMSWKSLLFPFEPSDLLGAGMAWGFSWQSEILIVLIVPI